VPECAEKIFSAIVLPEMTVTLSERCATTMTRPRTSG
jgi:hypothetical protein